MLTFPKALRPLNLKLMTSPLATVRGVPGTHASGALPRVEYSTGEEFDSSEPWRVHRVPAQGLIKGWQDGIPLVGGRRFHHLAEL